jgi:hypothetical protein
MRVYYERCVNTAPHHWFDFFWSSIIRYQYVKKLGYGR